MSAPRYARRRDKSEPGCVSTLRQLGFSVLLIDTPCDALLGFQGQTYLADFKTPDTYYGRKLNDNQTEFNNTWNGGKIIPIKTDQDCIDLRKRLLGGGV